MAAKIYFDDDCSMCRRWILRIQAWLRPTNVDFIPAQSDDKVLVEMIQRNSWIFETETGQRFYRYDGFLKTLERSWLKALLPLFSVAPVAWIGDRTYCFVANHRPTKCEIPSHPRR